MFPNNAQLINTNQWLIIPDHDFEEKLANHNNNQLYIIINNYKYESSLKLELGKNKLDSGHWPTLYAPGACCSNWSLLSQVLTDRSVLVKTHLENGFYVGCISQT